jgi:hypothetical protein
MNSEQQLSTLAGFLQGRHTQGAAAPKFLPVLHRGTLVRRKLLFVIRPVNSRGKFLAAKRQREHLLHTSVILGLASGCARLTAGQR